MHVKFLDSIYHVPSSFSAANSLCVSAYEPDVCKLQRNWTRLYRLEKNCSCRRFLLAMNGWGDCKFGRSDHLLPHQSLLKDFTMSETRISKIMAPGQFCR